jgi:hypothetical protein
MPGQNPISYNVTNVTPETSYGPGATPINGKRVAFSTSVGYDGSIFVPDSIFGDTRAWRAIIEAEVLKVAAAQAVTGTIGG